MIPAPEGSPAGPRPPPRDSPAPIPRARDGISGACGGERSVQGSRPFRLPTADGSVRVRVKRNWPYLHEAEGRRRKARVEDDAKNGDDPPVSPAQVAGPAVAPRERKPMPGSSFSLVGRRISPAFGPDRGGLLLAGGTTPEAVFRRRGRLSSSPVAAGGRRAHPARHASSTLSSDTDRTTHLCLTKT